MSSTKCKSYIVKQKLEIISKVKEISNKEAARIFEKKLEEAMCSYQSIGSGKKAAYPLAEKVLSQWIVQLHQDGIAVTLSAIKLKMIELLRTRFQHEYPDALELMDSFEGHLTESVMEKYKEMNTIRRIIPSGLISLV
ncbi:1961_t:CDS:2 [Racocetra fulgida]|uniref:1961_t:CDS:1 n=1 Tax=Racocetra fulgida TaxID=60492 RepID=A0A9N9D0K4_9GLOM|nr:1961_t:CDS:2 [Racocetra fulgida]